MCFPLGVLFLLGRRCGADPLLPRASGGHYGCLPRHRPHLAGCAPKLQARRRQALGRIRKGPAVPNRSAAREARRPMERRRRSASGSGAGGRWERRNMRPPFAKRHGVACRPMGA
eukprot:1053357-Prorocentrum_minimum.AAC.1